MSVFAAVISEVLLGLTTVGAVCVLVSCYRGYQRKVALNFEKCRRQMREFQDRIDLQEAMIRSLYKYVSNSVDVRAESHRNPSARPRESGVRAGSFEARFLSPNPPTARK